ncbi:hypothetical protein [Amycolatopsis sp. lyj-108]|uniref:hypothetical protein n=1 Tax=Amycolatopsis sp. lyj-108 TaxID=2789286 RepID=UPI00397B99FF
MPIRKKHLRTLHGLIEAPVDQVTPLVLDVPPADGVTVEASTRTRSVAVQGSWWYRSETTVTPTPGGSMITLKIYNVAQRSRWAVPLASHPALRDAPAAFICRLETIGAHLGVNAYPTTPAQNGGAASTRRTA